MTTGLWCSSGEADRAAATVRSHMSHYHVIEFAELDSTNRHACTHLAELAHGDVIQAAIQTAGRGRMDRSWVSHIPGNLCLSLVLKPQGARMDELPLANLSQLLALSACRVLDAQGVTATIKWPNDILVHGRKIAGILAETVVRGSEFLGLVLGIGVNLNLGPVALASIDQPATSLAVESDRSVDVASFRTALLDEFFAHYDTFMAQGFASIRDEYRGRCPFLGQSVEVRRQGGNVRGVVQDITLDGALELRTLDGAIQTVNIGEMFPGTEAA